MPPFANSNASFSVAVKPFIVWIATAFQHIDPSAIFRRRLLSRCRAVGSPVFVFAKRIVPARFRQSAADTVAHYNFGFPAIAFTKPTNKPVLSLLGLFDDGQLTKSLTSHVDHFGHHQA
jgi:hypothetical protein